MQRARWPGVLVILRVLPLLLLLLLPLQHHAGVVEPAALPTVPVYIRNDFGPGSYLSALASTGGHQVATSRLPDQRLGSGSVWHVELAAATRGQTPKIAFGAEVFLLHKPAVGPPGLLGVGDWSPEHNAFRVKIIPAPRARGSATRHHPLDFAWLLEPLVKGHEGPAVFDKMLRLRGTTPTNETVYLRTSGLSPDRRFLHVWAKATGLLDSSESWAFVPTLPTKDSTAAERLMPQWCAEGGPADGVMGQTWLEALCAPFSYKESLFSEAIAHAEHTARVGGPTYFVLDDALPHQLLELVAEEIPESLGNAMGCIEGYGLCSHQLGSSGPVREWGKNMHVHPWALKPATQLLLGILRSPAWVVFLESAFRVEGLIPDPSLLGSGVHQTVRGGFLKLHTDINWAPTPRLYRRVAVFVYLNPDWHDRFAGHLELWNGRPLISI